MRVCPSNYQSHTKSFLHSSRRDTRRQVMRHFTSNGTDQYQNGSSNLLSPCREQPRSTRILKKNLNTSTVDLLSIPQSGGKISKCLGGIIGCKYKTSSWHLNGFPDGRNIGATVYAYPRPAFLATKRANHAPISFEQRAQFSQGH